MTVSNEKNTFGLRHTKLIKSLLVLVNVIIIVAAIGISWIYSKTMQASKEQAELDAFCASVDSMKQISYNYLTTEAGYIKNWARYISYQQMSIDEALEYMVHINSQKDRYAHIVDMDTYDAYSTYYGDSSRTLDCYREIHEEHNETNDIFIENIQQMLSQPEDAQDEMQVLGKYRTDDTGLNVISVGTSVQIYDNGKPRTYLLLRVIPVSSVRNIWVFPLEYKSAEVGIITKSGAYVVPSRSMTSRSFADFIRGYNFGDDYNRVDDLVSQLTDTERGVLQYKNSKGELCYWYYSEMNDSGLDILGYIPVDMLVTHDTNWTMVILTCGVLLTLMLLDGAYILHMNARLRVAVKAAREADQAKTRFLSTMSHDIRTPLNGIIGMTGLALEHYREPEYVQNCLNKVSLAGDYLLTLVNDVLDISKIESGNMVLNEAAFSLEQSVEKLYDIVKAQMDQKDISFTLDKHITEPYVVADELRINQIFINILTNAVKYTPHGGSIGMMVRQDPLPEHRLRLTYRVSDTGIGMSREFQQSMYHVFSREQDSRIAKIQGTGLGLAIVKQMVDLLQGTIQCESEPGKGTTFTVQLDVKCVKQEDYSHLLQPDAGDDMENDFWSLRVLVAEDNDLNWEIICEMLKEKHVNCDRALDGRECVNMMQESAEGTYDLVLMDVQMPNMDGKQAARLIRNSTRDYVKNVMIVAMTADAFAEDVEECLAAGMNAHIAKPIDMGKVEDILRQAVQKKRGIIL